MLAKIISVHIRQLALVIFCPLVHKILTNNEQAFCATETKKKTNRQNLVPGIRINSHLPSLLARLWSSWRAKNLTSCQTTVSGDTERAEESFLPAPERNSLEYRAWRKH